MSTCQHEWQFLPRPQVTINPIGQANDYANAVCVKCHALTWAHGKAPNRPMDGRRTTPTTGRS